MNKYNPKKHHRRSIRLKGYDYAQAGLYYITICTKNRKCLFGDIVGAPPRDRPELKPNAAGTMIKEEWLKLPDRFKNIQLHEYIVMPNHFHAILEIVVVGAPLVGAQNDAIAQNDAVAPNDNAIIPDEIVDSNDNMMNLNDNTVNSIEGQPQGIAPTGIKNKHLGEMIGAFESITTVEYIHGVKNHNWQPFNGKLWQRNYWEHIIRNEKSYHIISEYIINNPLKWNDDSLNPDNPESKT
jgi:REP element-mobilizing transposase RayT